jgi:hypothetical protein
LATTNLIDFVLVRVGDINRLFVFLHLLQIHLMKLVIGFLPTVLLIDIMNPIKIDMHERKSK